MAIGVKSNNGNVATLLVEFKLNANLNSTKDMISSISEGDYKDKIKNTKILLFGSGIPVCSNNIFIFNSECKEVAKKIISQKLANASALVFTIAEFKTKYFDFPDNN
ncbi:MAG: hypothetical protein EBX41_04660 [Chitinophagia bacterium]|nr:hypothetical protein [Chitinophagia bacterium]